MNDAPAIPALDAAPPTCSDAGWCITSLPDPDLTLLDVWPLSNHAFAIAISDRGTQLIEWSSGTGHWSYVLDDALPGGATSSPQSQLWSPNENEVYFAFWDLAALSGEGIVRGYVNHGKRPLPPETVWSWTRHRFDCDSFDLMPRVWGSSADDVYVAFCKTIHRSRSGDGDAGADSGTSPWIPDYVDDDPANAIAFKGVTGTGDDDVWFVGDRGWGACAVVIRKTPTGYRTIVDGVPEPGGSCGAKNGLPTISRAFSAWSALANGRLVGVLGDRGSIDTELVRVAAGVDGDHTVDTISRSSAMPVTFAAVWGESEDDLWILGRRDFGVDWRGLVARGTNIWNDGGSFQYSTLVLNGAPNFYDLYSIRGTSNNNLWAVGVDRALHKASP